MRLDIGPFPSAGGQEWIAQARLLTRLVLDEFERYFDD